jgi:Ulp1 family protease
MILDSLGGFKLETSKNISDYLLNEAMHKLNIKQDEFLEPEFVSTFCPTQKNFVDCGVFCLHYINSLYQDPDFMMDILYVSFWGFYV